MPSTVEAAAVFVVALLPGASFLWAVERIVGRWGIGFSDRFLRFLGISALFHALAAPGTYRIWHDYLRADALPDDALLPWWLWLAALGYVVVPIALGTLFGYLLQSRDLPAWVAGANAAPTAWDFLFSQCDEAWIRLKLKSGPWVGGAYAAGSYVGGYPEPADIYFSTVAEVDPDTGEFARDTAGKPILKPYGLLVRWAEVEYLEFAAREEAGK